MERAETLTFECWLRDDGIVVGRDIPSDLYRGDVIVNENIDAVSSLIEDQPRPVMWDPRALERSYPDGWVVIIERVTEVATALAILVDDRMRSLLGAFPTMMDSLLLPVRLFDDEDQALTWLRRFIPADEARNG